MNQQSPHDADTEKQLEKNQFYLARESSDIDVFPFASGTVAVCSRRSPNKESSNEDAAVLIPIDDRRGVLAIADGCGGMAGGEEASRLAVKNLATHVAKTRHDVGNLRAAILDGIEKADHKVREMGTGAATTLAVVQVEEDTIRSYHVGDSSVLLTGSGGKIKMQTVSHSPVGYAIQAGVIDEEDAIHHEDRHLVSNVIGTVDTHIEIGPKRTMALRDTLLIASDGLFDNLHVEEIVEIIRKGPIGEAAENLTQLSSQRMTNPQEGIPSKPDDLSIILFRQRTS